MKSKLSANRSKTPPLPPSEQKTKLSFELYGINWKNYFPIRINDVQTIEISDLKTVSQFMEKNGSSIYPKSSLSRWCPEDTRLRSRTAKLAYYERSGDFFVFKYKGEIAGVFIGTPIDWSSYYIRNCSIDSKYQGLKYFQNLLNTLLRVLKEAGVERAETDIAPSNLANIHIFNKLRFNVSGIQLSERWGALVHLTRFLSEVHERAFLDQYCYGVHYQLNERRLSK